MLDPIGTFRFQISIPTAGTFLGVLLGIWVVGALIDHRLRFLTLGAIILFATVVLILGLGRSEPMAVYVGVAVWGARLWRRRDLVSDGIRQGRARRCRCRVIDDCDRVEPCDCGRRHRGRTYTRSLRHGRAGVEFASPLGGRVLHCPLDRCNRRGEGRSIGLTRPILVARPSISAFQLLTVRFLSKLRNVTPAHYMLTYTGRRQISAQ